MNKNIISIILGLFTIEFAQAQIPNGGFEQWEKIFSYEKPTGWFTNQDTIYPRLEKDIISIEGNYSLKLVPGVTSYWQGCESQAGTRVEFDSILPGNSVLTFYVKSVPLDPNEDNSVYLLIFGHTFNSDTIIDVYDWRTFTPIEEFTKIDIPLPGENIDEMTIYIYGGAGSNPLDGPCLGRSISWIDGMTIQTNLSGIASLSQPAPEISVYPNPSSGLIHINGLNGQVLSYELYTLIGELVSKGKIDDAQLYIQEKGTYFLKLFDDPDSQHRYFSKLIIVN